ncbi:haloacid dehalogenase [Kordiimonas sediminis]|uniref:Haloacid dehalogenase n=2 Tax=Kordiimonas sediminis TaxID=1735581 RepID=A0A919ASL0_9PROT|nr:haloacid dehalogenase [Kordiimonas sediminis]
MVDTVLFDIGNVFVRWDPRYLYEKLIEDKEELDFFLKNVVTLEWHTHHDRGRTFADGVAILSEQFPQYADLIELYDTRWTETIGDIIGGTVDVLNELADRGVPVYALTNFSAEKWPDFERDNAFARRFHGVLVSGAEKLVKPDPAIFALTVERFGLTPEKTLFIDDRDENVVAAKALGMQGHQFTDPLLLRRELEALSLL